MQNRYKIRVGKYQIGDKIGPGNAVITGFGREWTESITDDTACAWGYEPGLDNYPSVRVCYAYCSED